ncbi:hypothetical protein COLO4_34230 [Corchorus olitorius]|uniref:hAT-like transposase RNase-H fold domain-containing protein n=1 Tax=Corchorus olitorius TaxID=93759 RepID=A0A1R3GMX8_9ROSI|nr:hypothetical protein COLO4_34230 [Corchorus olitorius]
MQPDEGERIDLGLDDTGGLGETAEKNQSGKPPLPEPASKKAKTSVVWHTSLLDEIFKVHIALKDLEKNPCNEISKMASLMKAKYDKYWGEIHKMNMIVYLAAILDPRKKLMFVEFCIRRMFGEDEASDLLKKVQEALNEIFADYKLQLSPGKASGSGNQTARDHMDVVDHMVMDDGEESAMDMFWKHEAESGKVENKSELDIFLQEEREKAADFDVFRVVKAYCPKVSYPFFHSKRCACCSGFNGSF